ncbi:tRNA1(Val) (adenine(37)-N6)-methyltransferase [Pseudalkalibacillus berkeleyi]|uniref:tRNA1(Val) (Adenine(37)-N6)-methyltransferase n=1 Tax=Pseudalkalibacillus berkeleyi TaxID=1069813 RepID=A0ABS9H3P7_9BACL|nr:tRNA1(Val) (adenine(37)-N6)-methyltransferase [Pseudalkalibacillus berkeleyi]MCF6139573.1 tRNA1(Val) (adenine(37)-N6)-methyltransferase [Pseudalkalibacillus berkeleyi]
MTVELFEGERIDYIIQGELEIIQSPSVFTFSLDAVLLANFVYVPIRKGHLLDLCTGTGAIPLILSKRTNGSISGIEIQERLFSMAERSVRLNNLQQQIQIEHQNILDFEEEAKPEYDVVTCNPPYFDSTNPKDHNKNEHYAIARHEIYCSLDDVVRISAKSLRNGGKAAFVHRPERLMDLLSLMRKYQLEPKRLQFVYPKQNKEANMILVEGTKNGKPDLKLLPPIVVYNESNTYTEEVLRAYGR